MTEDNNPLFPFYRDKKFGFFNRNFEEVIPPKYQYGNPHGNDFGNFSEGFAIVRSTEFHGYVFVDKQGVEIDLVCYDQPREFSEDLAAVEVENGWCFIDTKGDIVIEPQFPFVESFCNGFARVLTIDCAYIGMINHQGEWVFKEGEFQNIGNFYDGLASAKYNNKFGYINTKGEWVVPPIYDLTFSFSGGLGGIEIKEKKGFIDTSGEIVIEPKFDFVRSFNKDVGLAVFQDTTKSQSAYGTINRRGEVVIEPKFGGIFSFSEGLACAYDLPPLGEPNPENLCGAIDVNGAYVITPQFNYIYPLYQGLARVRLPKMNNQYDTYYIDKTGTIVWSSLY